MAARYARHGGLTERQREVRDFLRGKNVSKEIIVGLLRSIQRGGKPSPEGVRAKVAFFESMRLDPKVYGVKRIPVAGYQGMLAAEPNKMKKEGVRRRVLYPLEDVHARKQLDRLMPGWELHSQLTRYRPATVLKKMRAAVAKGIKPTPTVLGDYSAESISKFRARPRNALDAMALAHQVERPLPESEGIAPKRVRELIVDEIVKRPHLAANRLWLGRHLRAERGVSYHDYSVALGELEGLSVVSRSNGFIRISKWFRTGTLGPSQQSAKVRNWLARTEQTLERKKAERQQAKQPA